jgi:hypothetical protein
LNCPVRPTMPLVCLHSAFAGVYDSGAERAARKAALQTPAT